MLLLLWVISNSKAFDRRRRPSPFLSLAREKGTNGEGHPTWRFPPIHGRKVSEPGPGFSTAHPCTGEKESTSCRLPLRALSTPTHRRTGEWVEHMASFVGGTASDRKAR